jgi:hypothetical protein
LKEANRLALDLIANYNLIRGIHYDWQGDELVITDEGAEDLKTSQEAEVDLAYATS